MTIGFITLLMFWGMVELGTWINFRDGIRTPYGIHSVWLNRVCKYTMLAYAIIGSAHPFTFFLGVLAFVAFTMNTFLAMKTRNTVQLLESYANGELREINHRYRRKES